MISVGPPGISSTELAFDSLTGGLNRAAALSCCQVQCQLVVLRGHRNSGWRPRSESNRRDPDLQSGVSTTAPLGLGPRPENRVKVERCDGADVKTLTRLILGPDATTCSGVVEKRPQNVDDRGIDRLRRKERSFALTRDQLRVLDPLRADQRDQGVAEQVLVVPVVIAERQLVQIGL